MSISVVQTSAGQDVSDETKIRDRVMTQEELKILTKAAGWLENIAATTKSSLMDSELSKIARSLEDIVNKYRI